LNSQPLEHLADVQTIKLQVVLCTTMIFNSFECDSATSPIDVTSPHARNGPRLALQASDA
jgi:hypothetical protein